MNNDVPFGAWLKQHRRALDLSREDLADQIGCSISLVEKIETGERRPSRQIAVRIAHILKVPADDQIAFVAFARSTGALDNASSLIPPDRQLPAPMTSFIGREWEIATVGARLRTPDVRLVTLTGAGGIGKTRLALQIASGLHDIAAYGVWFVDLAPISNPALVIATIAHTLGVGEQPGMSPAETLCAKLYEQQLLLLLDNFEQVVAAAPELTLLLAAVPGMKLLVTSREALRLSGEHVVVVAPLAVPDPTLALAAEELAQYAAAQLFVARAQAVADQFRLTDANASAVAAICARLDGLPLAIELAAAWVPLFPPAALLARLEQRLPILTRGPRDVPARQQTLSSTIKWSYDLLTAAQQATLRQQGVFVGGCSLAAIAAVQRSTFNVQDAELSAAKLLTLHFELLTLLAALVDKSLLRQIAGPDGDPRFMMLETIREYALTQLELSGEAEALRRRHAHYFLALVEQAGPELKGPDQASWLDRLNREYDNLHAVLAWSLSAQGDPELGLGMTMVWGAWPSIFESYEAYEWFEQALQHIRGIDPLPIALLARVLYKLGKILELSRGNSARATTLLEESLTLFQALGDRTNMAEALDSLGRAARDQGDYQRAQTLGEQSLLLFRAEEDAENIAVALMSLGDVALDQGDTTQATARFEEALAVCRDAGNRFRSGWALLNLGRIAYAQGDHARALTLYEETLALFRALDGPDGVIQTLLELGRVARAQGDAAGAAAYFIESLVFRREQRLDQRAHAYGLEGLAGVAAVRGQPVRALRLFGAAAALRESVDFPLSPVMRADYERDLATARIQLNDVTFTAAWAAGRALSLEQAIAYALEG